MKRIKISIALLMITCCFSNDIAAQYNFSGNDLELTTLDDFSISDTETEPGYHVSKIINSISASGYYRFFGWNRTMENSFRVIPSNDFANTPPYVIGVGDLYRDPPMILMNLFAKPGGGSTIGMDLAFYSNFTGNPAAVPINLNLGVNLYGSFSTDLAKFGFQFGGINWTEVSSFVFGSFQGYERFSIFERVPWEGNLNSIKRAQQFYDFGTVNRDTRFGMQAFKGALMDVSELPGNFSGRILFGKVPATASLIDTQTRYTLGGRLRRDFSNGQLSYNTMNYIIYTDSLNIDKGGINIHTLSGDFDFKKFKLNFEGGLGRLYSSSQEGGWGEGIRIKLETKKELTGIPLDFEVFRIDPNFVNYYGSFLSFNTTIVGQNGSTQGLTGNGGATSFAGSIGDVGQLSNNRQGFSVNAWIDLGENTKVNFGNMVAQELERNTNKLSFGHKINGLPFSRFVTFSNNVGPYGRWNSFFRGVSEDLFITDVDSTGLPPNKLTFNMFQFHLKQKFKIKSNEIYFMYVGSFGSAGSKFSLIPEFTDAAYLRSTYHEFDLIADLFGDFDFVGSLGLERIKGNSQTNNIYYLDSNGVIQGATVDTDPDLTFQQYGLDGTPIAGASYSGASTPSLTPLNQKSYHIGLGLDYKVSDEIGLYVRHRRYHQIDEGFEADDLKGTETTIEMKIYF